MGARLKPAPQALKPSDLERTLLSSPPAAVYLLSGPEPVLVDRALRALKERCVESEFEAFNFRRIEPAGLDAAALAEAMRVLPMGGGLRLIVIAPADGLLKDHLKALGAYAAAPSPTTCLVLAAAEADATLRKAFEGAVEVDCSSPWEERVPEILEAEARSLGVRLEKAAGALLAAMCGRDLSRAMGELGKVAGAAGPGGAVTPAMIRDLAGGGEAAGIFKVVSALSRADAGAAVRAARRFLETEDRGELRVLYECGMHLRRLLSARALVEAGASPREAAKAVRVFWKDQGAFASALAEWSEPRILSAFRRLLAADRAVKRGMDGHGAVEAYLWDTLARTAFAPAGEASRS